MISCLQATDDPDQELSEYPQIEILQRAGSQPTHRFFWPSGRENSGSSCLPIPFNLAKMSDSNYGSADSIAVVLLEASIQDDVVHRLPIGKMHFELDSKERTLIIAVDPRMISASSLTRDRLDRPMVYQLLVDWLRSYDDELRMSDIRWSDQIR